MQFLLLGYDGKDADAPARRQAVRAAHLEHARKLKGEGKLLLGGAILDDDGNMIGSAMVFDFPTEEEFRKVLETDPYVKGDVWKDVQIQPFKVANQ